MADRFIPLRDGTYQLASGFGPRWGTVHRGLDFAAKDGTPIYAAQAGTVAYIGPASGFGQWIVVDHPTEAGAGTTVYGHMWNAFATGLKAGDRVQAGQLIAFVGSNGESTGPHLHFEVHPTVWRAGSQIDPAPWLRGALNPGGAIAPATPPPPGGNTVGDPVWLPEALRPAVGNLVEYPGWRNRGHGDFKDIRGVMVHHTGGPASARSIADGRPDLAGPLSQLHIARDGTVTIIAAGVAWHAGSGSYPWLPTNMGNWHLIGIECEWPYRGGIGEGNAGDEPWRREQIIAIRNTCAALLQWLRFGVDRLIGHKDYAGRAQGKWDPGNMSMDWLRGEVLADMGGFVFPGEDGAPAVPAITPPPPMALPPAPAPAFAGVLLHRGMTGPAVVKLQERLRRNYSRLVADGDFGPATEAAVRDWQRLHPPLVADGIVGPATAAALGLVF